MNVNDVLAMIGDVSLIFNIVILSAIVLGALGGFIKGFWKASFQFVFSMAALFLGYLLLPTLSGFVMEINLGAFLPSIGGLTFTTLNQLPQTLQTAFPTYAAILEHPQVIELIQQLVKAIISLVIFILIYISLSTIFVPIRWIFYRLTVGLVIPRKIRKKKKFRLLGALFGALQGFALTSVLLLPFATIDHMVREIDNYDKVPYGDLLRQIGTGYGDSVLAQILKSIQGTQMPDGLDIAMVDHILGMSLNGLDTSLMREIESVLNVADALLATGFIQSDALNTVVQGLNIESTLSASQELAQGTLTISLDQLIAGLTPEIAQAVFNSAANSKIMISLLPVAIDYALTLDVVTAYVDPATLQEALTEANYQNEFQNFGAIAAAVVDLGIENIQTANLTAFEPEKLEAVATALSQSQLVTAAIPSALPKLIEQLVPADYRNALSLDQIDFLQYDWAQEISNIGSLASSLLTLMSVLNPVLAGTGSLSLTTLSPTLVSQLLSGLVQSQVIMDLFPKAIHLGEQIATQTLGNTIDIDENSFDWAAEITNLGVIYNHIYSIGADPLTVNWSTAEETTIEAVELAVSALLHSNFVLALLPIAVNYGQALIPQPFNTWVNFDLLNLEDLTGDDWTDQGIQLFSLYRQLLDETGQLTTDYQTLLADDLLIDDLVTFLTTSPLIEPILGDLLYNVIASQDLSALGGVTADDFNFQNVNWETEIRNLVFIAQQDLTIDINNLNTVLLKDILYRIIDSQVFSPALPKLMSGLATSFDLSSVIDGLDFSLENLTQISTDGVWKNEVDSLLHLIDLLQLHFGGLSGLANADFAGFLGSSEAPAVFEDLGFTMLDSRLLSGAFKNIIADMLVQTGFTMPLGYENWSTATWKNEISVIANLLEGINSYGLSLDNLSNILTNPDVGAILRDTIAPALESQILFENVTGLLADQISNAGFTTPADIDTWTVAVWQSEITFIANIFDALNTYDIALADLANVIDDPRVGDIMRDVFSNAIQSRLLGPIIKSTIKDNLVSANLAVPADIDNWTDAIWLEEINYLASLLEGFQTYGVSLSQLSSITDLTNAGEILTLVIAPAMPSRLLGANISNTIKDAMVAANLSLPTNIDNWTTTEWQTELEALGNVLTQASSKNISINQFNSIMDRDDIDQVLKDVVAPMFDSRILDLNVRSIIQDAFTASPSVTLPSDIDSWTTSEWKEEINNLADVMATLKTYNVSASNIGTIMDLDNAADAVEDILTTMMDSRMLKTSVKTVLLDTVSDTGFTTPDTTTWDDTQWKQEISAIANVLRVSKEENLSLNELNGIVLTQQTSAPLGRLLNAVADSQLLIDGLNSQLNTLFLSVSNVLESQPIDASQVEWVAELGYLSYITDNIDNLGNVSDNSWVTTTRLTLKSLRRSSILGDDTETLLVDGFSSLGVNDYINSQQIVYWIDVDNDREDLIPVTEPVDLSLDAALTILKDTKDSLAGSVPTGNGQAEALFTKINDLDKDYGWIADGKLTEIVTRGLGDAGIETYLGASYSNMRPEMVETDEDELIILGQLMDTIGDTDLNAVGFDASNATFIHDLISRLEALEMFKSGDPLVKDPSISLIENMFATSGDLSNVLNAPGLIYLGHEANNYDHSVPVDECRLNLAINKMLTIKDALGDTSAMTDSSVLKGVRDLEIDYQVIKGRSAPEATDGTLASYTRDVVESGYFADYSADFSYNEIYLDEEIDRLVGLINSQPSTIGTNSLDTTEGQTALATMLNNVSDSMFFGDARQDILNDLIDTATGKTGSDLTNSELPDIDWNQEISAVADGLDLLPASGGSMSTLGSGVLPNLFDLASPTRILSRILVTELNGLSSELESDPLKQFGWSKGGLTYQNAITLEKLINFDDNTSISQSQYSSFGDSIKEFDSTFIHPTTNETYTYNKILVGKYLPNLISKGTGNTFPEVSRFNEITNYTSVGDNLASIIAASLAVEQASGVPGNPALTTFIDYISTNTDPEIAELGVRINGQLTITQNEFDAIQNANPDYAVMFVVAP